MKPLRLAFLLLLTACAPTLTQPQTKPIIPGATAQTLAFRDYTTYYETLGEGDPVVLVHGIGGGSSVFQYRKNAAALADAGYKVYALDLLGFGRSSSPEVRYTQDLLVGQLTEFLEGVLETPAAVVANGLSAAYAVRIAAERLELVGTSSSARPDTNGSPDLRTQSASLRSGAFAGFWEACSTPFCSTPARNDFFYWTPTPSREA